MKAFPNVIPEFKPVDNVKPYDLTCADNMDRKRIENQSFLFTASGIFIYSRGKIIQLAQGGFYGLTKHGRRYYVFCKDPSSYGSIYSFSLVCDRIASIKRIYTGLSPGVHQIDFIANHLFIMDTYRNEIVVITDEGNLVAKCHPFGKLNNGRESHNYRHINSVFSDGRYLYLILHNETYKTGKSSQIVKLHKDTLQPLHTIENIGGCCHNIIIKNGFRLTCDSLGKTLMNFEKPVFQSGQFTRGVSMTDDFIIVGGSMYERRGNRVEHAGTDIFIYFLDHRFRHIGTMKIENLSQIFEIRSLPKDYGLSNTRFASHPDRLIFHKYS